MPRRPGSKVIVGLTLIFFLALAESQLQGASIPTRARYGMVVSQSEIASRVGAGILSQGGNAVDAAVATALALAVTHPTAGNIGGGGYLVYRPVSGPPVCYDFRETAPARASREMFLREGKYDPQLHHNSILSVGVPGSVAGLYLAWQENGRCSWKQVVEPSVLLARDGFVVSEGLARSLQEILPEMKRSPAAWRQFSRDGTPYEAGDILKQPDLSATLDRIAREGPRDFYEGKTARLVAEQMKTSGGLITLTDLKGYRARKRTPLLASYRGYEVISMPPSSSGGITLIEMLNILEGFDLSSKGFGSAVHLHWTIEAMRRAYADRARFLGDPEFNPAMPADRLISKEYAATLRKTVSGDRASRSTPELFEWPAEGTETTHLSAVDAEKNAVALTTTLEYGYGSRIVVSGAGFLVNNEMGDFNGALGLTTSDGLIGTEPNLAAPGKRMLSSMTPTILVRNGGLSMVTGSPGGRTISNTVLQIILNVVDFGMNIQEAVDAPRIHHQWIPDVVRLERFGFSPDALVLLESRGHVLKPIDRLGVAEAISYNPKEDLLEGAADRRSPDGAAIGVWERPSIHEPRTH